MFLFFSLVARHESTRDGCTDLYWYSDICNIVKWIAV